jgi:large subunit ribosomal protein L31
MKENQNVEYRDVVFVDMSSNKKYLCGSAVKTKETIEYEGKTYPSVKVSISSSSHPFFTGDSTFVDSEGRVDKFNKRYAAKVATASSLKDEKEEKDSKKKAAKPKAPKNK